MDKCLIAPSVLAADFGRIKEEVEMLNKSQADYIHIDIMDGVFVPNISFGFPVTKAIAKHAKKPLDFHLMITNPDLYLEQCKDSGAEIITVHYEACNHLHRTVEAIKSLGIKAGVALNPHTPVDLLDDIFSLLDLVLIMSVNPGFGGQKFIPHTYTKVSNAREKANLNNPNILIEIDGGVTLDNYKELVNRGANMLVAGSFVFNSKDPIHTIAALKDV
ncbi:MAG: ribulose-phosphate 3-epimerase [Bacteroidota bacterium]